MTAPLTVSYIVYGTQGECSDWSMWNVATFSTQKDANDYVTRLKRWEQNFHKYLAALEERTELPSTDPKCLTPYGAEYFALIAKKSAACPDPHQRDRGNDWEVITYAVEQVDHYASGVRPLTKWK